MKKSYCFLSLFIILLYSAVNAQNRTCGTAELHQLKMQTVPEYRAYYENMAKQMAQWSQAPAMERSSGNATITIPVVVHVLWNNAAQNISDAQIQSQIDALNEDFAGTNTDKNQIPSSFLSKFGTADIYFCLAARDGSNNYTTGIERRQTSITSFNGGDSRVKDYATGGLNAWDRNKYLNIWVVNLGGGLLGYTEMPGGWPAQDGTVILYKAFGRVGTLLSHYNKGRTATHEIGHWLGLFHTWGDDGGSCGGSDYISDTPNEADALFGTPTYPTTDGCSTGAPGVMYMNYMDYTDDAAMHMFSAGQATVMRNILNTTRAALLSSNGCSTPTGLADINGASYINLYPNPATDIMRIDIHLPATTILSVAAYDIMGKLVKTSDVERKGDQTLSLDISSFNNGIYMLVVNTSEGNIAKKFTVTH